MRRGWWVLRRRLVCGGILVGLMAAALAVAAEMPGRVAEQEGLKLKVDHKYIPKPEELKYVFATAAPVLRVQPGDTVQTWTERADGNVLQKPGRSAPMGMCFRNPATGFRPAVVPIPTPDRSTLKAPSRATRWRCICWRLNRRRKWQWATPGQGLGR